LYDSISLLFRGYVIGHSKLFILNKAALIKLKNFTIKEWVKE